MQTKYDIGQTVKIKQPITLSGCRKVIVYDTLTIKFILILKDSISYSATENGTGNFSVLEQDIIGVVETPEVN